MDPYVQTDAFKTPVRVIRGIAPVVGVAGVSSVHWYQMTNDYEMTSSDDIHPIILKDSYVSYLALKPEYDNTPLTSTKSQPTQQNSSRIRIRIRICNQYLEISYRQCLQRCSCSIRKRVDWRENYRCFIRLERESPISEKEESTKFAFYKKTGFPVIANSHL